MKVLQTYRVLCSTEIAFDESFDVYAMHKLCASFSPTPIFVICNYFSSSRFPHLCVRPSSYDDIITLEPAKFHTQNRNVSLALSIHAIIIIINLFRKCALYALKYHTQNRKNVDTAERSSVNDRYSTC